MARINVNPLCNVLTRPDTHRPYSDVEITIPQHRLNLGVVEVERMINQLLHAAEVAHVQTGKYTEDVDRVELLDRLHEVVSGMEDSRLYALVSVLERAEVKA